MSRPANHRLTEIGEPGTSDGAANKTRLRPMAGRPPFKSHINFYPCSYSINPLLTGVCWVTMDYEHMQSPSDGSNSIQISQKISQNDRLSNCHIAVHHGLSANNIVTQYESR